MIRADKIGIILVVLLLSGCSATRAAHVRPNVTDARGIVWNDARCYELLQTADNWTFTAKLLVGAGGTSAIAAPVGGAISDDEKEQRRVEWGLGITAGVTSAAGLAALWMGEVKRREFEEYCQTEPVEPSDAVDVEAVVVEPSPLAAMPVEWVEYQDAGAE
ncbi:MAG: hypothetical protein PHX83_07015 [Acidobacteriia bacterium]|nr:hypothetical protein [Terriglobia bacterium]